MFFFSRWISEKISKNREQLLKWDIVERLHVFPLYRRKFRLLLSANALLVMNNHQYTFVNNADRSFIPLFCKLEYDTSGSICSLSQNVLYIRAIGQVWGQDGWILAMSGSINSQKKRPIPISSNLDRTSLVNKGFLSCLSRTLFLQDTAQHSAILPARLANHRAEFGLSCPHIKLVIWQKNNIKLFPASFHFKSIKQFFSLQVFAVTHMVICIFKHFQRRFLN